MKKSGMQKFQLDIIPVFIILIHSRQRNTQTTQKRETGEKASQKKRWSHAGHFDTGIPGDIN